MCLIAILTPVSYTHLFVSHVQLFNRYRTSTVEYQFSLLAQLCICQCQETFAFSCRSQFDNLIFPVTNIGQVHRTDVYKRQIITGPGFEALTDEEALDRVLDLKIMCRARPTDKPRLVQLLQQKGAVVAVTGDGTNDAPALKAAQVGLSMGDGTSVAKEASDITIIDNSFSSITRAVDVYKRQVD